MDIKLSFEDKKSVKRKIKEGLRKRQRDRVVAKRAQSTENKEAGPTARVTSGRTPNSGATDVENISPA